MSERELWSAWSVWMGVAAVVVLLAAGLLLVILLTARRILGEAVRALRAVEIVRANTQAIWQLQATNQVAEQILHSVESIERKGGALAGALQGDTVSRG